MADNYLEKKMEALQERKAKEQRLKQIAWKKRMDAYRKRLEEEAAAAAKAQLETTGKAPKVKAPAEKRDVQVYFRLPSVCTVTIKNGVELLLQSRVPVYQLGKESSLPVNVILK